MKLLKGMMRKAYGFSLLELLLVVGVGSVLIMSGLSTYRLVVNQNNTNMLVRSLIMIQAQVEMIYQKQSSYSNGGIVDDMNAVRALPTDIAIIGTGDGAYMRGPYGPIEIIGQGRTYIIRAQNLPLASCVRLGQLFTPKSTGRLVSMTVGGNEYRANDHIYDNLQVELMSVCSVGGTTIEWEFN